MQTLSSLYASTDAMGLANHIKNRDFSVEAVIQHAIQQINQKNPQLHAVTQIFSEAYIQKQIEQLDLTAPFAGVPMLLKDLGICLTGMPTLNGSASYQEYIPQFDNEIVHRLRQAGFIFIGKTATPEFGLSFVTEPESGQPCRNPLQLELTPGGSSGGAAAAVASGMVPMAHASDGGGSIRVPAACCGLIGLKPTRARVPMGPILGEGWSGLSCHLGLSRTVRDSALLLDLLAGPELGDPYAAPAQSPSYLAALNKPLGPLKIAYNCEAPLGQAVHSDYVQAVEKTLGLLTDMGHHVEAAKPEYEPEMLAHAFFVIISTNTQSWVKLREFELKRKLAPTELERFTWMLMETGQSFSGQDYAQALLTMHYQSRKIARFFTKYDLFITPTLAKLPLKVGHFKQKQYEDFHAYNMEQIAFAPFTQIWNQTGQPAISLPMMKNADGLPIGVQAIGRFGDEELLLNLAAKLETYFEVV